MVERLEIRYSASNDARAAELMDAYRRLIAQFEQDLSEPRDVLLSKGAALMMIRCVLDPETAEAPL